MTLPLALRAVLEAQLGAPLQHSQPVRGGDINQAARLETHQGSFFLKWNRQAPTGMFAAEVTGLARLRQANALRVPEVIAWAESEASTPPTCCWNGCPAGRAQHQQRNAPGRRAGPASSDNPGTARPGSG
ncbi:MAG: fructosamine kinase family protein [Anaerolineae bacterium]|nr:fructosamine kinase family protein [Anaerolineae bacterium]